MRQWQGRADVRTTTFLCKTEVSSRVLDVPSKNTFDNMKIASVYRSANSQTTQKSAWLHPDGGSVWPASE
jgi:hypothetical protein